MRIFSRTVSVAIMTAVAKSEIPNGTTVNTTHFLKEISDIRQEKIERPNMV